MTRSGEKPRTVAPTDRLACTRLAIAAIIAGAGCDDPSLRVEVERLDGFAVAKTTVAVYQSDMATCRDIELGIETADTLTSAFVASAVIDSEQSTLIGVSRLEPKLFVALAEDAAGRKLYAGCEPRGEIEGDDVVVIKTHPIASVTMSGDALDRPFAKRRIEVAAADAEGRAIDARHIEWTSYGVDGSFPPDGSASSALDVCTVEGRARIEPADPDTQGPIAALVRVSWADQTPAPLSGFIGNAADQIELRVDALDTTRRPPSCAVRTVVGGASPGDHVYCLMAPRGAATDRQIVELDLVGADLALTSVGAPVATDHLVATNADDTGTDDLYAVEWLDLIKRIRWTGVAGTAPGGQYDPCDYQLPPGACNVAGIDSIITVPSCGVGTGFAVTSFEMVAANAPDIIVFTDLAGEPLAPQPAAVANVQVELLAGGCVAEATTAATRHQAFAGRVTPMAVGQSAFHQVSALCDDGVCSARWGGTGSVGFSRGDTPRLVTSETDITGNVIIESEIVPAETGQLLLIERQRTATTAPARAVASADIDGDDHEDLAWSQFVIGDGGLTENRIQLAVEREGLPFPGRLSGVSPGLPGAQAFILFAHVDDDDVPDLVTFSDQEAAVYRFGVPVPHDDPPGQETTCN